MSMLAERKRKQKWSLNPRGKFWADDSNKFGQKLLEKMGWAPGKGLGLKEDGMTEHIKVAYKNDSEGMGYKKNDNQWTEHEINFSSLLVSLAGTETTQDNTVKVNSLEKQSKSSKARLHYKKFTKGKDLSKCSEKDLANIFGKKSLNESSNQDIEEEEVNEDLVVDNNFSYGGSMSDYFKKKLPSFSKSHGYEIGSNGVLKNSGFERNESESESETTVGFGFKEEQTCIKSSEDAISKKKKIKKKRSLEDNSNLNDTPSKKKKTDKLKKKELETGLSNPAFDPLFSPAKMQKHILEPIEESTSEMLNDTVGEVAESFKVQVQINNDIIVVEDQQELSQDNTPKKRKKNKNKMKNLDDLKSDEECEKKKIKKKILDNGIDENMDVVIDPNVKTVKKKRKKKHENVINKELVIESSVIELTPQKITTPKKALEGTENQVFSIGSENESIATETENPYELKPKKNKKYKSKEESPGLINPLFDSEDMATEKDLMNKLYEVKRNDKTKKKKKHQEPKKNEGIDNPALTLDASIEEECDLILNIASTPVITTPKITEQNSIHKVKPVSRRKSVRFSDVTRERIIPSKEDIESETLEESREIIEIEGILNDSSELSYIDKFIQKKKTKKSNKGIENSAFDQQANNIEENITSMAKTIDSFQAEVENDINEAKIKSIEVEDIMVGEVGNPEGDNEKLEDGTVKLKFKHANFKRVYRYMESLTGAKKSYKHLIKGDIVVGFRDTNLHQIEGYAAQKIS
ncbi:DNA ligase 1-like [Euwallacea fornicatus]|uniref:DNA ligase 1-like n=1 Tax=Euwallacea fornicatus TaxID=995702 RepID=UPI00338ECDD0